MSNKAKSNNTAKKVEEPVYDQKFLKVWETFWQESENVVNHDVYLLKFLKVEYPDMYEPIRKLVNSKQTPWKIDLAIRKFFKEHSMLPKTVRVKKANGKSKGAK